MESKDSDRDTIPSSRSIAPEQPVLPLTRRDAGAETKPTSLAYLDGLRGIAALIVYSHHHITEYYGVDCDLMHAYGYQERYHFLQWRFMQLFVAGGSPAVMIFFVLSGYVLSRGVLQMLQNGKSTSAIHQYLLNALLKRPTRLWLPVILVSFPIALAFQTPLRPVGAFIQFQVNIFAELRSYVVNLLETVNPWIGHGPFMQSFNYDPPVWTMAYELNGSVLIYAVLAIVAPFLELGHRMIAYTIILFVSFEYGHFSLVPFMLGMMLAQMDVASLDKPYLERLPENRRKLVLNAIFVVGWYLLSDIGGLVKSEKPWFGLPAEWIPFFFYNNPNLATTMIGATFMVYASLRLDWLQHLLNRAAWLGRVSFALYLTHIPFIWFVAYRVRRFFGTPVGETDEKAFFDGWFPIPDVGPLGLTTRYLAMQLVVLPLNLILAEFVTIWVDQTSVTASKRLATRVMKKLHL